MTLTATVTSTATFSRQAPSRKEGLPLPLCGFARAPDRDLDHGP